jgi:hypothetical protein
MPGARSNVAWFQSEEGDHKTSRHKTSRQQQHRSNVPRWIHHAWWQQAAKLVVVEWRGVGAALGYTIPLTYNGIARFLDSAGLNPTTNSAVGEKNEDAIPVEKQLCDAGSLAVASAVPGVVSHQSDRVHAKMCRNEFEISPSYGDCGGGRLYSAPVSLGLPANIDRSSVDKE